MGSFDNFVLVKPFEINGIKNLIRNVLFFLFSFGMMLTL